jgi:hypothetical protein
MSFARTLATALIVTVALATPAQAQGQTRDVYDGRLGQIDVRIPRIDTTESIDGYLTEPVWQRAALLTGFSEYQPVDGRDANDSTEVLVWYGRDAIYFGIRAFEAHGPVVRATLANRDNIDADDHINVLLDTYNGRRQALLFAVNPLGVQEDGVWSDGVGASAGGQNSGGRIDASIDLNPDYVYQSLGHVTAWGYEVEIRIPFKSLHYQGRDPQTWGFQIDRVVQHSGYEETWTRVVRASTGYLLQSGALSGLTNMQRGLVMDITPEITQKFDGAPPASGLGYGYKGSVNIGGTVRWGITQNLTTVATARPDFSQVEADVGQVSANQRFALFYPEKRPFFLEGLELFSTNNTLIYTRQIVQPDAGYKLIGELGGMTIGYLGAVDTRDSATGAHPIFNILRLRGNVGRPTTLGLVYTDRIEGNSYNRVLGGDARYAWNKLWYSQAQIVESWTQDMTGYHPGTLWDVTIADRTGRAYGNHFEVTGLSPEFAAQSGFVNRVGFERFVGDERFSWYGPSGAVIEQVTTRFVFNPLWRYGDLQHLRGVFEGGGNDTWTAYVRGGWTLSLQAANVMQAWDPSFYAGYRVARGADTVPFAIPHALHDLWTGTGSITTPNRALYGTASLTLGDAPIFAEAARGHEAVLQAEAVWHPTRSLRFDAVWAHQIFDRVTDGSRAVTADIPRLKIEYQLTSSIFFRYVGQYTAQTETPTRDPQTGYPLLVDSTTALALGLSPTRDFRQDILFSFQPTPGTVVLLGYGATLTEPDPFQFRNLSRQQDGLIVKLSYLFRL